MCKHYAVQDVGMKDDMPSTLCSDRCSKDMFACNVLKYQVHLHNFRLLDDSHEHCAGVGASTTPSFDNSYATNLVSYDHKIRTLPFNYFSYVLLLRGSGHIDVTGDKGS